MPHSDVAPTSVPLRGPTTATRSPPKSTRETSNTADQQDSALTRFARLKQAPASLSHPDSVTNPNPEKWSVKDTSVNIASAIHQAAVNHMNPNASWASGANKPRSNIHRGTSADYESQAQTQLNHRRLPVPPNRSGPAPRITARKPVSSASQQHAHSDSDELPEESSFIRGKSPLDNAMNLAGRAAFFLKERVQTAVDRSHTTNGNNSYSYDYSAEEKEVQADSSNQSLSRRTANAHKRNRMSVDNKAYKPSQSDLEASSEDVSDDDKRKRRKSKKNHSIGGPLTTLPVIASDKRKKKRPRKGGKTVNSIDGEQESESDDISEQLPPPPPPPRQSSLPLQSRFSQRGSVPPEIPDYDVSVDNAEQGLKTIPEAVEEEQLPQVASHAANPSHSKRIKPLKDSENVKSRSCGALIGTGVRKLFTGVIALFHLLGTVFGTIFDLVLRRPWKAVSAFSPGPLIPLTLILTAFALAFYFLSDSVSLSIPSWSSYRTFQAPDVPINNIAELSDRLQRIESVLSTLSADTEKTRSRQESDARAHSDFASRVSTIEGRLLKELSRAAEAEAQSRTTATQGFQSLKHDIEALHSMFQQVQSDSQHAIEGMVPAIDHAPDEEARERLKLLEERIGSVEGGVREALEMGRTSVKASSGVSTFWKSLGGSKNGLTIKSNDGQDVTSLIGHLVNSAVSLHGKDGIARPDFALWSGGAAVIPSLTSSILEFVPKSFTQKALGLFGGEGYAVGNPPVTALHHDIYPGRCWPFAGSEGQLGVKLAAPVHIEEVTIDHAAREVVLHESELRSAPRDMELWGLVEGKDNIDRVSEWRAEKDRQILEAEERGDSPDDSLIEPPYPRTLPRSALYIRIAKFTYDVHAPHNIQTFPVIPEIKDLGLDFGIVALRVVNNWGRSDYTCLYRMRVHGQRLDAPDVVPLPTLDDLQQP